MQLFAFYLRGRTISLPHPLLQPNAWLFTEHRRWLMKGYSSAFDHLP
jgi:hypothetical protein